MPALQTTQPTAKSAPSASFITTLIITALIAGTLDIVAAVVIFAKGHAEPVLRYIASSLMGKEAKTGAGMVALGLCIHYLIAAGWVTLYFILYKYVSLLRKNIILSSVLYGVFVYLAMQFIFVPMTKIHLGPFNLTGAITNAVILMFTIGLPAAWARSRYALKNQQ